MRRWIWAVVWFVARLWLLAGNWEWNSGTVSGILPGLHCWYCTPWQAPYGLLWHLAAWPGTLFTQNSSFLGFTIYISIMDLWLMLLIQKTTYLYPTYLFVSGWIFLQAPWDLPVLWWTLAGLYAWPLATLGIFAKLPVGAPYSTWNYLLTKPYLNTDFQYYGLMGLVFIAVLLEYKHQQHLKVGTEITPV